MFPLGKYRLVRNSILSWLYYEDVTLFYSLLGGKLKVDGTVITMDLWCNIRSCLCSQHTLNKSTIPRPPPSSVFDGIIADAGGAWLCQTNPQGTPACTVHDVVEAHSCVATDINSEI